MAATKFIPLIIVAALLAWIVMPALGLTWSSFTGIVFLIGALAALKYLGVPWVRAFPLNKSASKWVAIAAFGYLIFIAGVFGGFNLGKMTAAFFPGTVTTQQPVEAEFCVVSEELRGKSATLTINAYDMMADDPYATAIDTNAIIFKEEDGRLQLVGTTIDTSAYSISSLVVGDVVHIYGTGSSYYLEPAVVCVDAQQKTTELKAYKIATEADLQIIGYDDAGNILTAGDAGEEDYKLSLGAGEQKTISLKLRVNAANKAYNFYGWAVATFNDIDSVEPVADDKGSSYTVMPTVKFLKNIAVQVNGSAVTITEDYTPFVRSEPILLREWEAIKTDFVVKAPVGVDPVEADDTTFDGFAIVPLDAQWARGSDGKMYLDFYAHTTSQSNVGLLETLDALASAPGVLITAQ